MYRFDEYQRYIRRFDRYPKNSRFHDLVHGLCSEAGEVAGVAKKVDRDNITDTLAIREKITNELGDVLWYVAMIAEHFRLPLYVIASANVQKLSERERKGTLHGDGDDR